MPLLIIEVIKKIDYAMGLGDYDSMVYYGWKEYFEQLFMVHATGVDNYRLLCLEIHEDRKKFLWFGSTGGIYKGLDLLIEAFRDTPECNFHIVGAGLEGGLYEFDKNDI